jgi:bifunctional UDP-N-acetylglucosamine pyrophosphorylase/glucosamine-1-phosphate N-acetyltransferase
MKSSRPKHFHTLLGRRLIDWVIAAVDPLSPDPLVVVCSQESRGEFERTLGAAVTLAVQERPLGTGDAVRSARAALAGFDGDVLVLAGDTPLLQSELLDEFVAEHRRQGSALSLLSFERPEPASYGRVIRNGSGGLAAVVEEGDASPEQRRISEVNASVYVFAAPALWSALDRLEADNAQGELYLTDAVGLVVGEGLPSTVHNAGPVHDLEGVNTRAELAFSAAVLRDRILGGHMVSGVGILDPATTWIDVDVEIEPDATIHPFTVLRGSTRVGAEAEIGPHVVAVDAVIDRRAMVGPFCYLRPGTRVGEAAKVGTFVEIKESAIGAGAKVPHLSYIGDADVGEGTNIGAGAITANYRPELGSGKQRTVIGRDVHTGSHNVFVAPIEIGDGAWIGAGSTITEDVPPGALAIARARQVTKEGYGRDRRD